MELSIKELLEFLKALEKNDTYEVEKSQYRNQEKANPETQAINQ